MSNRFHIPNTYVLGLISAAQAKGVDVESLFLQVGAQLSTIEKGQSQLNGDQFTALMRSLWSLLNDEAAGFTQRPMRLGAFRMMCHAALSSQNLKRSLIQVAEFFRLMSDEFKFRVDDRVGESAFVFEHESSSTIDNHYFLLSNAVIILRWAAWMINTPILLNRVHLSFNEHHYDEPLEQLFLAPVFFNRALTEIVFPDRYLSLPILQTPQTLHTFLSNAPECLLTHFQRDNSFTSQVRQKIEHEEELDHITMELVAEQFNISKQTLARHLKKEGHQFQEIKDKVRQSRAINFLLRTDLTTNEISQHLGFSESSVFFRTFKKWTGLTPNEYRKSHI